jgi:Bacterial aa3 type cytochrome c oxidase subunit IV
MVLRLEDAMDDHGQLEYATATGNDYAGHEQMYRTFVMLTKSAVAVIAVVVILMAIFLT